MKRIKGDLVGDESYFNGSPVGSGWEWEDLTWSYGAQISALTINDNAIDLNIKPGAAVGVPVTIVTGPPNASFISVVNRATTSAKGLKSDLQWTQIREPEPALLLQIDFGDKEPYPLLNVAPEDTGRASRDTVTILRQPRL